MRVPLGRAFSLCGICYRSLMKSSLAVPLAILAAGFILAGAVYVTVTGRAPSPSSGNGDPAAVPPISLNDHILGNPAARVAVVSYTDFDCPFCTTFDRTMRELM